MVGFLGHNHIVSSGTSVVLKKNDNLVLIMLFIIQEKTNS